MTLEYNIVWFEDAEEYIRSFEPQIRKYLGDLGFELDLTTRPDDSDLTEVMKKNVDLIMVDDNLGMGKKGVTLVDAIRNNELYTAVVFYSQYDDFLSKIRQQFEGIFYAKRDDLLEKTKTVINLTIKKNQDISNIRGLFIAETIDLTEQVELIISNILKLSGAEKEFFLDSIVQDEFLAGMAKFRIIQRFLNQKIKSLNQKISSSMGSEKSSLTQLKADLDRVAGVFKRFQGDVIYLRNELAHAKKKPGTKNTLIVKNKEREYDEEKCKQIRGSFIKHSKNLKELEELLGKL